MNDAIYGLLPTSSAATCSLMSSAGVVAVPQEHPKVSSPSEVVVQNDEGSARICSELER